jgi:hypothetical protein
MASFQRRHYVAVASIIIKSPSTDERLRLMRAFATLFESDNPRFDLVRWKTACLGKVWDRVLSG